MTTFRDTQDFLDAQQVAQWETIDRQEAVWRAAAKKAAGTVDSLRPLEELIEHELEQLQAERMRKLRQSRRKRTATEKGWHTAQALASGSTLHPPLKYSALRQRHKVHWPTIERDIKDAASNGLAAAAKAGPRDWHELRAIDWAKSRGKYREVVLDTPSLSTVWNARVRRHKL